MRWRLLAGIVGIILLFAAMLNAATQTEADNGAEEIMIDAGPKGTVFFPHRQHQESEGINCQTCHDLFPREPNVINRLIKEGTLSPRQVMNALCISCHRKTATAGKPSGPRSCSTCHGK